MSATKAYADPTQEVQLLRHPEPRSALFLDRDGVINVNRGYVHTVEATEWVPGIFEFCNLAQASGFLIVVVTNQAGIARGYYNTQQFIDYTSWVHQQFAARGVPLAATYFCPHHPEIQLGLPCECRKPAPGMILGAGRELKLSLPSSILVGDSDSDLKASKAAGLQDEFLIEGNFDRAIPWLEGHASGKY